MNREFDSDSLFSSFPLPYFCERVHSRQRRKRREESSLPLNPQRELNCPRIVPLPAEVLQASYCVESSLTGTDIIWMVEDVKEVRREPRLDALLDSEVLEDREINVPRARTKIESPGTRIIELSNRSVSSRSVGERLRNLIVEVWTQLSNQSLSSVDSHQILQVAPSDVCRLRRIEITSKPQSLPSVRRAACKSLAVFCRSSIHQGSAANLTLRRRRRCIASST